MLKSYLTLALRSLLRHPGYTSINVFGLAVGIACCLLIFLYMRNELAVNTVFNEVERIYRVDSQWREASMGLPITTLAPVGQTLVREYPEVQQQVRIYLMTNAIRVGQTSYRKEVMMADSSLMHLFDLALLHGDPARALSQPRSVVITERLAQDLFGTIDALGQTILFETWSRGEQPYTVTGVRRTLPYNTVTYFGDEKEHYDLIIAPYPFGDYFPVAGWTSWNSRFILQYVKLAPGASFEAVQKKLEGFVETYAPAEFHGSLKIHLNPLRRLYLSDNKGLGWRVVKVLGAVAVLLLLIATINFMNLSTARSLTRAREIGVRKTLGANKAQLVRQFLGESVLICALGTVIGAMLAWLGQDLLFQFTGKDQVLAQPWDGVTFAALLGVTGLTGLGAGLYPALVLSGFKPVKALKGSLRINPAAGRLRHALVVAQFAAAIVLLVAVVMISRQLSFVTQKDLGFDKEHVLVINSVPRQFDRAGVARMETVKRRLEEVPRVVSASLSWRTAAERGDSRALQVPGSPPEIAVTAYTAIVDEAFLRTFGLTLREGRFFSSEHPADSSGLVLNESAVRALGWQEGTEGKRLILWNTARPSGDTNPPPARRVLGVVADYHFESLHQAISPLAIVSVETERIYRVLSLRLSTTDLRETVARLEQAWAEVLPLTPFVYVFLDDQIDRAYRTEQQVRGIVGLAATLAFLIACLGMLGLASFSVIQRTKEVGIRKVLGATVTQIVLLLSKDFAKPVLVAILIALPIAYVLMHRWLEDFAYRVELSWSVFLMVGLAALGIALLTVSYHAIDAATTDPAQTLRYE